MVSKVAEISRRQIQKICLKPIYSVYEINAGINSHSISSAKTVNANTNALSMTL